jgi:hypothetical protein
MQVNERFLRLIITAPDSAQCVSKTYRSPYSSRRKEDNDLTSLQSKTKRERERNDVVTSDGDEIKLSPPTTLGLSGTVAKSTSGSEIDKDDLDEKSLDNNVNSNNNGKSKSNGSGSNTTAASPRVQNSSSPASVSVSAANVTAGSGSSSTVGHVASALKSPRKGRSSARTPRMHSSSSSSMSGGTPRKPHATLDDDDGADGDHGDANDDVNDGKRRKRHHKRQQQQQQDDVSGDAVVVAVDDEMSTGGAGAGGSTSGGSGIVVASLKAATPVAVDSADLLVVDGESLFKFLYSKRGFANVMRWFEDNSQLFPIDAEGATPATAEQLVALSSRRSRSPGKGGGGGGKNGKKRRSKLLLSAPRLAPKMSENHFLAFMRSLTSFKDFEIMMVFDIFDSDNSGSIGFAEFFLLISMYTARQCGQSTQFLYLHSRLIFALVADPTNSKKLTFERFTRFAFVLGMSESHVHSILEPLNFDVFDLISYDDFVLYYFALLDSIDEGRQPLEAQAMQRLGSSGKSGKRSGFSMSLSSSSSSSSAAANNDDDKQCTIQ